jgi:hypothetical protein
VAAAPRVTAKIDGALTSRGVSVIMPLWEGKNVLGLLRTGGDGSRDGCW